ncbi:MAG: WYL domain-containing protein [Chloroflexota bacterium]|nr:WYL domain-containing protein [Chloroflexota bacterium]
MTLRELLDRETWRRLRAMAHAHQEPFDSRFTKKEAIEYVLSLLTDRVHMRAAVSGLPSDTEEALQTLLACGGEMPADRFVRAFGPIRPFRPWQDGSPRAPWRNPVSPGERLWFLGFIFFRTTPQGRMVLVPDDLRVLIHSDPLPKTATPTRRPSPKHDVVLDLAHLLAYLQGHDVHPFAGRWLTLRHLRAVNVGLAHPDPTVEEARSELQTGYLRFLHYLAESSGLLAVVGGLLKPMPAAWPWLDESDPERWQTLWRGWREDLSPRPGTEALWARYRFPGHPAFALTVLESLQSAPSDRNLQEEAVGLPFLAMHVRRRCIGAGTLPKDNDVLTLLQTLVSGPLTWGCLLKTGPADNFTLTSLGAWLLGSNKDFPEPPATEGAAVRDRKDRLVVILPEPPVRPPMFPLVALGLPCGDQTARHLTRQRFVSFLAEGVGRPGIAETLRALTTEVLPREVIKRLKAWEKQARGLTIRRLTVLAAADTQTLGRLAEERGTRDYFLETLSPHHVAVDPSQVDALLRTLRYRGHTPLVEPGVVSNPEHDRDPLDSGAAAHLWVALRTYLNLSNLIHLPALPPVALLDQLEGLIDESELTELAALAEQASGHLRDLLDGYSAFPAPLPDADKAAMRGIIERALESGHPVRIVYHTAGRGERTDRVVEPLRLEERGGAHYLIAYCRLRQEERVFRIDRIEEATPAIDR